MRICTGQWATGTCIRTRRTVNPTQVIRPWTPGQPPPVILEAQLAPTVPQPLRPPISEGRRVDTQPLCLQAQAARTRALQPHTPVGSSPRQLKT